MTTEDDEDRMCMCGYPFLMHNDDQRNTMPEICNSFRPMICAKCRKELRFANPDHEYDGPFYCEEHCVDPPLWVAQHNDPDICSKCGNDKEKYMTDTLERVSREKTELEAENIQLKEQQELLGAKYSELNEHKQNVEALGEGLAATVEELNKVKKIVEDQDKKYKEQIIALTKRAQEAEARAASLQKRILKMV